MSGPSEHTDAPVRRAPQAGPARTSGKSRILNRTSVLRSLAVILALAAVLLFVSSFFDGCSSSAADNASNASSANHVPLATFYAQLDAGGVASVTINADTLEYSLTGADGAETGSAGAGEQPQAQDSYWTDNPQTPDLVERILLAGAHVTQAAAQKSAGDILGVILDAFFYLVFFGIAGFGIYKALSYSNNTYKVVRHTGVSFDDVAGMEQIKRDMRTLVDVLKHPQDYARRGVRPVKGVILEGPPGNGKTLFARALAQEAGVNFIATKGADFQSVFMSLGPGKIRSLFRKAARHKPVLVFIDEFDAIGERRNYAGTGIDKENNRIITAMLNEMDGFVANDGILVVAATNSYRSLDPALIRAGRFDLKFTVGNPDAATRRELIAMYTTGSGRTLETGLAAQELVDLFDGLSCAAIETVLNGAAMLSGTQAGHGSDVSSHTSDTLHGGSGGSSGSGSTGTVVLTRQLIVEAARKSDIRLAGI